MTDQFSRAREMIGVPFKHLGRDNHGLDCIGLVVHAKGYPADQVPVYPRDPYNNELERHMDAGLGAPALVCGPEGATASQLLPGDVLAIAYRQHVRHVGLVAAHPAYPGQLSIIHTDSSLGNVTEHILDAKWLRRVRRVYRP